MTSLAIQYYLLGAKECWQTQPLRPKFNTRSAKTSVDTELTQVSSSPETWGKGRSLLEPLAGVARREGASRRGALLALGIPRTSNQRLGLIRVDQRHCLALQFQLPVRRDFTLHDMHS